MDGFTLPNNINTPLQCLIEESFVGEKYTLDLLLIYHLRILTYINKISKEFM